jgi:hypothetical protein
MASKKPAAKKAAPAAAKAPATPKAPAAAKVPAAEKTVETVLGSHKIAEAVHKSFAKDPEACSALVPDVDKNGVIPILCTRILYGKIDINQLP